MNTVQAIPLFSQAFQDISSYIASIRAPYTLQDIQGFNTAYKRAYPSLSREEKRRIEAFVDTMIERVAQKELASKIFGVV
ncbi:hypothetical protein ABZN20_14395 [Methylococcus sp. ANG]|uniref:hypothetical protein n=1 Tax=unclassified Methylococcus TaxID=2618889 RepID=UPI001C531A01|nr:hypothetical protein [Methylococcus sp. Mc7]QXP85124.1 hypothetical protein KW115_05150 [Methylococcus sp. Mc7]